MTELEQAREIINSVDRDMAALFEQRMEAVKMVAEYKAKNNLPIFDAGREQQVIEKNCALLQSEALIPYYQAFLHSMMDISKDYQREILSK